MIQTTLAINGQDCTIGDGNSPEEFEAIAATFLRTAEAIRNGEEGWVECLGDNGEVIAAIHVHHCDSSCDESKLNNAPTIDRMSAKQRGQSLPQRN